MHIGVDIGNYYTKTSELIKFESRMTSDDSVLNGSAIVSEYKGKKYLIENGSFDISMDKTIKPNLMVSLATAIALSTDECNVDLAVGLPINHYKNHKDILTKLIEDNSEIEIVVNNKHRRILINSVMVIPEAVGVYYSFSKKFLDVLSKRDVLIVDIGGKTTDTCIIDSKKSILKPSTQPFGMLNLYNNIKNEIDTLYPEYCARLEDIMDIANNGLYIFGEKKNSDFIEKHYDSFVNEIINFIKLQYENYQSKVIILSGGGHIFADRFKKHIPNIVVNADIFANANGFKQYLELYKATEGV